MDSNQISHEVTTDNSPGHESWGKKRLFQNKSAIGTTDRMLIRSVNVSFLRNSESEMRLSFPGTHVPGYYLSSLAGEQEISDEVPISTYLATTILALPMILFPSLRTITNNPGIKSSTLN